MEEDKRIYEFGEFRLDQDQRLLFHRERPVKVSPKDLDLLFYFVCNSNRVIEKDRLMEAVWPDSFVEESNLAVHISNLRRIFSQDGVDSARIETFPKRGYRFSASVRERVGEDPDYQLGPGPRKNAISEGGSDFLPFEKE